AQVLLGEIGSAARTVEAFGRGFVAAATAALDLEGRLDALEHEVQMRVDEPNVIVVVRVLHERFPVDRIDTVEIAMEAREPVEAVSLVAWEHRCPPLFE